VNVAGLELRKLVKSYNNDGVCVVHGVDLEVKDGEFVVFVGPSGCGKSTTLRMIAGLEEITGGEIRIGSKVVNEVPAAKRGVAMVFQTYALYPHMTVKENLGFALKLAGVAKGEIEQAIGKAARILKLEPLLERKPKALSGGQRQRVAIGRCIVRQPEVFLFDEPLSNLDAALRVQMREEIARLHQELGTTMVYVTHDQVEAMTLGDRIVVFNDGRIEQVGTPQELYECPANTFVARFIGSPAMNLLDVDTAQDGGHDVLVLPGGTHWRIPAHQARAVAAGQRAQLGLRPEHLGVGRASEGIPAVADLVEYHGSEQIVHLKLEGSSYGVTLRLGPQDSRLTKGERVGLLIDPEHFYLFSVDGDAIPLREARH
jgi:multiple sugar transport system ATP-binding protein